MQRTLCVYVCVYLCAASGSALRRLTGRSETVWEGLMWRGTGLRAQLSNRGASALVLNTDTHGHTLYKLLHTHRIYDIIKSQTQSSHTFFMNKFKHFSSTFKHQIFSFPAPLTCRGKGVWGSYPRKFCVIKKQLPAF